MNSRSRNYSGGWPGGVSTNVVGSRFVNLPGQSILPGLTTADSDGNVRMELSDGGLAGSLPVPLVFATDNKIAVAGSNTHKVSAKAFVRNGVIAGKFTPIGAKKPVKFKTVILQKQSAAYGFFFGRTGGGAASLLPNATP
jgi:hypothetical protein